MKYLPQALAFSAVVAAATVLEITGKDVNGLWIIVVLWILFGTWRDAE